jgi:hypothetical protein
MSSKYKENTNSFKHYSQQWNFTQPVQLAMVEREFKLVSIRKQKQFLPGCFEDPSARGEGSPINVEYHLWFIKV